MKIWLASLKRVRIMRQVKETLMSHAVMLMLTRELKLDDSKKN